MSVLPAEIRQGATGERWAVEFDRSLESAKKTLARRKTIALASSTLWIAILLSFTCVVLVRYTLLDIPRSIALIPPFAWLLAVIIIRLTRRIRVGESARYLDRKLELDECVTTSLEFARSTPVLGLRPARSHVLQTMLDDAAFQLKLKYELIPSGWGYRLRRWQLIAITACVLALIAAIFLPTPLDQVRAERAELQRVVRAEMTRVAALRAELVGRPGLDDDSKAAIDQELQSLQDVLATPDLESSAMLAAIADTQERLKSLSPEAPSDFLGVIAAARTVQNAAVAAVRNARGQLILDVTWDPADFPDLSDLGKAANAAGTFVGWVKDLNTVQLRLLSGSLDRAGGQAASENTDLAQHLVDASQATIVKDLERSETSLRAVAQDFLNADKQWQRAAAVEKALADLDDGRQTLANAGSQQVKKGQVGFRRPGAPSGNQPSQVPGTTSSPGQTTGNDSANSDGSQGVSTNDPSAFGGQMGSNSPDYTLPSGSQSNGGQPASGGQGTSQGGSQGGSTGGSQSGGGQPGSTAGGGNGDTQGTFGGQVTGPIGGVGGAISQVQNPAGQGVSNPTDPQSSNDPGEQVYVPTTPGTGTATGGDTGTNSGSNPPGTEDPNQDGIEGRGSGAGDSPVTTTDRGSGVRPEIRTPYKEVYGDYAKQASQALDATYIPADAKQYVKEYFTELGK